jgi:hypothetical protein
METTNGYWVLRVLTTSVCCLLKCGERVTPIMPHSECVKRFATLDEAWEACDEIKREGMHPFFVRTTGDQR